MPRSLPQYSFFCKDSHTVTCGTFKGHLDKFEIYCRNIAIHNKDAMYMCEGAHSRMNEGSSEFWKEKRDLGTENI